MIHTIQIKHSNPEHQNWSVSYDNDKITGNTQSFQDKLVQNQKENKDNSQDIRELVGIMKDNARVAFSRLNADSWRFLEYCTTNQLHATNEDLPKMSDFECSPDLSTYSERYKSGARHIQKIDFMPNTALLINISAEERQRLQDETSVRNTTMGVDFSKSDYEKSIENLTKMLDKVLGEEYAKNSNSSQTNALLILRAELDFIPEKWEMMKKGALETLEKSINQDSLDSDLVAGITTFLSTGTFQSLFASIAEALYDYLSPSERQEMYDSVYVLQTYCSANELNGIPLPNSPEAQLKTQSASFKENLISRFSAIDNTEILFNLFGNSSLHDSKESKSHESLIDTIRAKLKTTDDSILQKVMSRISNAPKSAEASA